MQLQSPFIYYKISLHAGGRLSWLATILPFRGIRYNEYLTGDLGAVITPPYDVIKPEEQAIYYRRSPYNIIRLEYGYSGGNDSAANNRYTRPPAPGKGG